MSARRDAVCDRAPAGWRCWKDRGHDGPCPLWPRPWRHPLIWLEMWGRTR